MKHDGHYNDLQDWYQKRNEAKMNNGYFNFLVEPFGGESCYYICGMSTVGDVYDGLPPNGNVVCSIADFLASTTSRWAVGRQSLTELYAVHNITV